ncbi:50S ribosomal protein L5 [Candidatus Falkowbacteria bacterium CG10_big_fil_rev_8_21_14_0_10_37_6]|uniref:Large ribosomal subunit protein uL5 n=1 Tax=Candidatus Falkowbacteria bacterium CG10_big_fil_rev_8_21_14_0_10_37_6 TaxID=1974563 RepID=A0A2H0V7J1_9BACT|nr:MAG: 50S ribosomal protein L5 [Candidatus Falkowbacteria bacterium CG10_big_fil_rev_8_21_14_0_10_37_6]
MRLSEKYKKEIMPKLVEEFGYSNSMSIPRVNRVTVNVGVGRVNKDKSFMDNVENTLKKITGQNPIATKAKKSIASFKVREGSIVGMVVTLRGQRMYDFLEKLINISLPRVRDFRGLSTKAFDKQGNLSIGFKENISFPEIRADEIEKIHGLEVCISTTANSKPEGESLLRLMGFPLKKE